MKIRAEITKIKWKGGRGKLLNKNWFFEINKIDNPQPHYSKGKTKQKVSSTSYQASSSPVGVQT